MKIGIVELDHHLECLNSLCQILDGSGYEITVFTTRSLYGEIKNRPYAKNIRWEVSQGNVREFLIGKKEVLESQDLLFFSTIESHFRDLNRLQLRVPKIARIHNANTFLKKNAGWYSKWTPYWLFKDLSYFVRKVVLENEIRERRKFIESCAGICFTSDSITEHVRNDISFDLREKVIDAIPITFNEWKPSPARPVRDIAIVGTIDRKRKDYPLFRDVLKSLIPKLDHRINLRFMGRPKGQYGREMISSFLALQGDNLLIQHWPKGLSQDNFDLEMTKVDVLIAPIYRDTKYFLRKEEYGLTKISGSINDCIKYARPGIIPDFYPIPKGLDELFIRYGSKREMEDRILDLINGQIVPAITESTLAGFRIENIRSRTLEIFNQFEGSKGK